MADIGTDNDKVIYAQGQSIKAAVEQIAEMLKPIPEALSSSVGSQTETKRVLKSMNDTLNSMVVAIDKQTEYLVGIDVRQQDHMVVSVESRAFALAIAEGTAYIRSEVDQYRSWITPLIDDFHKSAILPTMGRIEGKVTELLTSHGEIKGLVEQVKEQVNPLIDSLSKSPLLSMLGVKKP